MVTNDRIELNRTLINNEIKIKMGQIKIKKGLNLPISRRPVQVISDGKPVKTVALLGDDSIGLKLKLLVAEGDSVKLGQALYTDKSMPRVQFTSPGSGKVIAINRGEKRKFLSIVIALNGNQEVTFPKQDAKELSKLRKEDVVSRLLESGLWTALRSRPYSRVADPDTEPHSIFVTAMDTNPLAPSVEKILKSKEDAFSFGLEILSKLTDGQLYLCKSPGSNIPTTDVKNLSVEEFSGPHPAGNPGTHIHFLDPVDGNKTVWHIGAQDVAAIGTLFTIGKLDIVRVIALAGSGVRNPKLVRTRLGASLVDLTSDGMRDGTYRVISGSVLSGRTAKDETAYLGRYHQQVTAIREFTDLGFFGWMNPGLNLFSIKNILLSRAIPKKVIDFTTALHGGERAIVPIGSYEKVMPLDILPTHLLRALAVDDIDEAEKLGCLELDEEDLALCTLVCPSKIDHGRNLRRNLTIIEKEG